MVDIPSAVVLKFLKRKKVLVSKLDAHLYEVARQKWVLKLKSECGMVLFGFILG